MKRLVICFDGTWQLAWDSHVSNVEKIARAIAPAASRTSADSDGDRDTGSINQLVYYVGGVGSSYSADRLLGGSMGLGLTTGVMNAYRFLALNFQADDEVYIFGFSRGAFSARTLAGMLSRTGLVRPETLAEGSLNAAYDRFRQHRKTGQSDPSDDARFRESFCHPHVCIPFLGVFDTVDALGPRVRLKNSRFLDETVAVGRQALAIDDRRRIFAPHLWTGQPALAASGRVRQVWFRGFHIDAGGGCACCARQSNQTLLWMVCEAIRQGLQFDDRELLRYVGVDSPTPPAVHDETSHDSMKVGYRVANGFMRTRLAKSYDSFSKGWRQLDPLKGGERAVGVGVSSVVRKAHDAGEYTPPNLASWLGAQQNPSTADDGVVSFDRLDQPSVVTALKQARAAAADNGGAVHQCPHPGHAPPP